MIRVQALFFVYILVVNVSRTLAAVLCQAYLGGFGGVGGVWNKKAVASSIWTSQMCFFFKAYRLSRDIRAFASVYLSPMLCSSDNRLLFSRTMLCSCGDTDNAGVWRSSRRIWRAKFRDALLQSPHHARWHVVHVRCVG